MKHPIATAVMVGIFLGPWQASKAQSAPAWMGTPGHYMLSHHARCYPPLLAYGGYWCCPLYLLFPVYVAGGAQQYRLETEENELPDMPPANARPLSDIVRSLENKGLGHIVEIEFEDAVWEVELVREGELVELRIDPLTAEVLEETD